MDVTEREQLKAELRQASLQRHLTSLKTNLGFKARSRLRSFMTSCRSSPFSRTLTTTNAFYFVR